MRIHSNLPGPLVARLRREWRINFFVETGTCHGDTTELASIMFDQVWSCDIDGGLIDKARERLAEYSNVRLSVESSPDFLRRIKPQVCQPVMYWLDGHWCGGPTKPAIECPLIQEIEAIGSFNQRSILLIDDINLVENPPKPPHDPKQWPTMAELRAALSNWGEPYTFEWYQGTNSKILAVTPEINPH